MRTKTKTWAVYKFDELSPDVQDKVIDKMADINVNYEWWDFIYDDAKDIYLKIKEFDLDRNRYCKAEFIQSAYDTAQAILKNHGEKCETYKTASEYLKDYENIEKNTPDDEDLDTEQIDKDFLYSLQEDYGIILQKEYEYLTSRKVILETIEANEYEFTQNGHLS